MTEYVGLRERKGAKRPNVWLLAKGRTQEDRMCVLGKGKSKSKRLRMENV